MSCDFAPHAGALTVTLGCCRFLCGDWFEYESERGGVAGYKSQPLGMCSIILKNQIDIPVVNWHRLVKQSMPNSSRTYPPPPGRYSDDTWEHWVIGQFHWAISWLRRVISWLRRVIVWLTPHCCRCVLGPARSQRQVGG